ncbi:hypothetical protein AB4Y89_11000 [Terriglobus sp. 2YAB30_2]|uniref:hypothetical protein n=1 Tax=unclassified Terriglobus TaxID=2628988 RepID=UPI003F955BA1
MLREQGEWQVGALLTSVNEHFRRIAIHGVREDLLDRQAEAAGLPLWKDLLLGSPVTFPTPPQKSSSL